VFKSALANLWIPECYSRSAHVSSLRISKAANQSHKTSRSGCSHIKLLLPLIHCSSSPRPGHVSHFRRRYALNPVAGELLQVLRAVELITRVLRKGARAATTVIG